MADNDLEQARATRTFLTGNDPDFVGFSLAIMRRSKSWDREQLAQWLGVDLLTLDRLAICPRIESWQPDYKVELDKLATQFKIDPARLHDLLRRINTSRSANLGEAVDLLNLYKEEAKVLDNFSYEELAGRLKFWYKTISEGQVFSQALELVHLTTEDVQALTRQLEEALANKNKDI